jgi:hypothetical protein
MRLRELLTEGPLSWMGIGAKNLAKLIGDPDKAIKAADKLRSKYSQQLTDLGHNELLPIQGHTQIRDLQKNLTKSIDRVGEITHPRWQTNKSSDYGSAIDAVRKREALELARREAQHAGANKEHLAKLDLGIADAKKVSDDAIYQVSNKSIKYDNDFQRAAAKRVSQKKWHNNMTDEQKKVYIDNKRVVHAERMKTDPEYATAYKEKRVVYSANQHTEHLERMKTDPEYATVFKARQTELEAIRMKNPAYVAKKKINAKKHNDKVTANHDNRMKTDPEYAARARKKDKTQNDKKKARMKTDSEYAASVKLKRQEAYKRKLERMKNDPVYAAKVKKQADAAYTKKKANKNKKK